jgi:hypothetical protein
MCIEVQLLEKQKRNFNIRMNSCNRHCARFEIPTAANIQIKVFFDMTPRSLVEILPTFPSNVSSA